MEHSLLVGRHKEGGAGEGPAMKMFEGFMDQPPSANGRFVKVFYRFNTVLPIQYDAVGFKRRGLHPAPGKPEIVQLLITVASFCRPMLGHFLVHRSLR
jgi:hypothetical protein